MDFTATEAALRLLRLQAPRRALGETACARGCRLRRTSSPRAPAASPTDGVCSLVSSLEPFVMSRASHGPVRGSTRILQPHDTLCAGTTACLGRMLVTWVAMAWRGMNAAMAFPGTASATLRARQPESVRGCIMRAHGTKNLIQADDVIGKCEKIVDKDETAQRTILPCYTSRSETSDGHLSRRNNCYAVQTTTSTNLQKQVMHKCQSPCRPDSMLNCARSDSPTLRFLACLDGHLT